MTKKDIESRSSSSVVADSADSKRPIAAVLSLLSSIGAGLCWLCRDLQFRHALNSAATGQRWLMMDINVFLRRMILILTVVSLVAGLKAVTKRTRALDIFAFIIAVALTVTVSYILYTTGGCGFWLSR